MSFLSPQAEWKHALLIELGERFNLQILVETGTCYGGTINAVKHCFSEIHSIEIQKSIYDSVVRRFAEDRHVKLYHGSSRRILRGVLSNVPSGPLLFWLDAHITGGTTENDGDQINEELKIITEERPDSLIVIDDVKPDRCNGYEGPDAAITIPEGYKAVFLHGVLIVHDGRYNI